MEMKITFGDQELVYRKKTWKIVAEDGSVDERGVRYGENPDQEAALYELTNGNLVLGDCRSSSRARGWSAGSRWRTCSRWASIPVRSTSPTLITA